METVNMEFVTFQRFGQKEEVLSFSEILKQNKIDSFVEDSGGSLDSTLGNSQFAIEYALKVKKSDFDKVEALFSAISKEGIENIDEDYFLFQFSNEELKDVLIKKDEWGYDNYDLAQKILSDRGIAISKQEIDSLQKERLIELAKPEKIQTGWVIVGYICAVFGGFLGILTGWYLMTLKKTLPDGERVYSYLPSDRKHGKKIFITSIVFAIVLITVWIFKTFKFIE
ncbi:MAG: hypothetical protein ABI426_05505 [Flavobacterium sp.]